MYRHGYIYVHTPNPSVHLLSHQFNVILTARENIFNSNFNDMKWNKKYVCINIYTHTFFCEKADIKTVYTFLYTYMIYAKKY